MIDIYIIDSVRLPSGMIFADAVDEPALSLNSLAKARWYGANYASCLPDFDVEEQERISREISPKLKRIKASIEASQVGRA
jgi:hypothetical protein